MKTKLRVAGLVAMCLVLVAFLSGCSEPDDQVWPKTATGETQTHLLVAVPTSNPWEANNATPNLSADVLVHLAAQWDPHPDVEVQFLVNAGCPPQTFANCFEVWRVPETVANPVSTGPAPACWPNCAFALRWVNTSHVLNGFGGQPSALIYPENWEDDAVLAEIDYQNMLCHEGGHFMSLNHWDDDNDGIPDAQGPCVDAVPDRDTNPSDGTAAAFDWSALDLAYDRCVRTDASYAPLGGVPVQVGAGETEVDAAPECSASAARSQEAGDGPVVADIVADEIEEFTDD